MTRDVREFNIHIPTLLCQTKIMIESIVELPLQAISWNRAYGIANNRIYKMKEAKEFQEDIALCYQGEFYEGDVEMEINVYRNPICDVDNNAKMILDSLEGKAYAKDSQVRRLIIEKFKCEKGQDKIVISIKEFKEST